MRARRGLVVLASLSVALSASAQTIEVIYTKIGSHPTGIVPGALDGGGLPTVTQWRAMEDLRVSQDGTGWVLKGRTQLIPDQETILVKGAGTVGTMFAQEGQPIPSGAPGELYDFFSATGGAFNSLGHFAFACRAKGGVASVFQKIMYWDGVNLTIEHQMGDLLTGLQDLAPNPSGDEIFGNSVGSAHPLDDGRIGLQDSTILMIHTSRRPAIFYDRTAFHQTGVTSVNALGGLGSRVWSTIDAGEFNTTPDGAHWLAEGVIVVSPTNLRVLVLDGNAVLQVGEPVSTSGLILGDIFQSVLLPNGDWLARGRDNSGTTAAAPDWAVRNNVLIAKTGDPITPSTTETWGDTLLCVSANQAGDYIVIGNTSSPDLLANEVMVLNGTQVIAREGDHVDLNGNGLPDDDAFIGRNIANPALVAFQGNDAIITDDRYVYFLANLRDGNGNDLNTSGFGTPDAFLRINLGGGPPVAISDIDIDQITWDSDDSGLVPFSEYAQVRIVYTPPEQLQWFLSMYLDRGFGPALLVSNLPLLGRGIVGDDPFETTTLVDLGQLNVERGQPIAGQPYQYSIVLTEDPIADPPIPPPTQTDIFGQTVYTYGGVGGEPIDATVAYLPPAADRPAKPPFIPGPKLWSWRNNFPNRNVGLDQCTPASMAMSAHWLNSVYNGAGIDLGNQTWYQTLAKFKADLETACPGGTLLRNIIRGKLRFYQRPDKGLTNGWRVKYQGDRSVSGNTVFPASVTEGALTAHRMGDSPPGTAVKPQFDFVLSELANGEDVEIHVGWLNPDGTRNGGHSLGVRGALRHGNKMYIWTTDDSEQDPCTPAQKPSDLVPPVKLGLRNAHCSQVLINPNGSMQLAGLQPNEVELVTSESPPLPCPGQRGDANCDGSIDFFDIDPFLLALFDPAGYAGSFCGGSFCAVDTDCGGAVDFFDIDPFLGCLFSGCADCP